MTNTKMKKTDIIRCVCFGSIVASVDETIQILSGRGSSFFDVMIDTSGYLFALLMVSLLYFVSSCIIKKARKENVEDV